MKIHLSIKNVCKRLFDELVKELLLENFTVVSASYKELNGCKIRRRKAHLRRRRR